MLRTRGTPIVINKIHQVANTTIDTTEDGAFPTGSQIRLLDGVELNGQELTTDGGTTGRTRVAAPPRRAAHWGASRPTATATGACPELRR